MKSAFSCGCAIGMLLLAAAFAPEQLCRVTLTLNDANTNKPLAGVIRITQKAGDERQVLKPTGLDTRGWGLERPQEMADWFVVPQKVTFDLPRGNVVIEAFSGLETTLASVALDLTGGQPRDVVVPLKRFSRQREARWCS